VGDSTFVLLPLLVLNPNFSVEKFALGDGDSERYGQDVMINPALQIVAICCVSCYGRFCIPITKCGLNFLFYIFVFA
jgi:hypothetical protein